MKKTDVLRQLSENARANEIFNRAVSELDGMKWSERKFKKFRSCSAETVETENFILLRSYNTYIAALEKKTDTLADVLRTEYGYTSTSAQHVAKFARAFGSGKWGAAHMLRSYDLSREDLAKVFYLISETNGNILTLKEARKEWKEEGETGYFWSWYDITNERIEPDETETAPALATA